MLRHGKGILDIVGGLRYEGNWSKNYMDGKGFAVMLSNLLNITFTSLLGVSRRTSISRIISNGSSGRKRIGNLHGGSYL